MENNFIPESELILRSDGSIYHLGLQPEQLAETIIVVGDPDRVPKVSRYFDSIECQVQSREFVTHTGRTGDKKVTVISSGMGTDNVEILMTELDALVNIDLRTRTIRDQHTCLNIIRIGTSGCMHADIPVDSLLVSSAALGLDTLMSFYHWKNGDRGEAVANEVRNLLKLSFIPYFVEGSEKLLNVFGTDLLHGLTVTSPGFYAPQGRELRLKPSIPGFLETLSGMHLGEDRFTNFEMETAGYYAMAKLLGHEMVSLNALVANRVTREFSKDSEETVDRLIRHVIEKL